MLRPEAAPYTPLLSTFSPGPATEKDTSTTSPVTMKTGQEKQSVALRTIPVILKNGGRQLLVNGLIDEGSDTTYINEDVAVELGLPLNKENISVKVAND